MRGRATTAQGSWDEVMGDVSSRILGGERILRGCVMVSRRELDGLGKGVHMGGGGGKEVVRRDDGVAMRVDGFYEVPVGRDEEAAMRVDGLYEVPVGERCSGAVEVEAGGIGNANSGGQEQVGQHADNGRSEPGSGGREEASQPAEAGEGSGDTDNGSIYISSSESEDEAGTSGSGISSRTMSPELNPRRGEETGSIFDLPANYVLPSGAVPTVRERTEAQEERTLGIMRFLKMRKAALDGVSE